MNRRSVTQPALAVLLALSAACTALAQPATDPLFKEPYIDIEEWRDQPLRHRYIHGGFKGTDAKFSIYFPPKDQYQGRFFQHITPVPVSENLAQSSSGEDNRIAFSILSGAYFLETNEGGMAALAKDRSLAAYRVNAAAAQHSRLLAAQMYGPHRTYGYAYGGSGGGYRTIGGIENTTGVWDGVVPYVIGSPMALPNVFTARMLALRVLQGSFPAIVDALEPGGSGDIYRGLNQEQRDILTEVTRMGFPLQGWFGYKTLGLGSLPILFGSVKQKDPTYFDDFWTLPGYAGASLAQARIQHKTKVKRLLSREEAGKLGLLPPLPPGGVDSAWRELQTAPSGFEVDSLPAGNLDLADVILKSGDASGRKLPIAKLTGNTILIGSGLAIAMGMSDPKSLLGIKAGDELIIDNSDSLAVQYLHRYQVPTPDFYVWNQFRTANGTPLYPQRQKLQGPEFAASAAGTIQSGRFEGKMIVVESLWDQDAFPWQADWYATKVKAALGTRFDDNFRLWFIDHAIHGDVEKQADPTHTISYLGVLHQALRDLSAWCEKGIAPPQSTSYKVVDGQVQVPPTAAARKGIQPVVTLKANGGTVAKVRAGQLVTFTATAEAPPQTGQITSAEWDFEGTGTFQPSAPLTLKAVHTFSKPGTYFTVLRIASQRQGDTKTPYARIQNLARVRVIVR